MRKGDLTVILARFPDSARKYVFSKKLMRSVALALVVLVTACTVSALHYYHMWQRTAAYDELKVVVDQLRKENEGFRLSAAQLAEKLSSLEVNFKKLKVLSGLDREGLGGVGGPSSLNTPALSLSPRDLRRHFSSLDRRSINLETELRQLQDYYTNQAILLSKTPAIMPVRGYPSGAFGYRGDPFSGEREFHTGIDISAPRGQKVIATADGFVSFAGHRFAYGRLVVLDHRLGITTRYGHLDRIAVKTGQRVKKGDIIGYVGSSGRTTGVHLHYEVRLNEQPLNPLRFFRESD